MSEKKLSSKTEIAFKILVYSGALDRLEDSPYGLCNVLYASLMDLGVLVDEAKKMAYGAMRKYFKEIYKHKPIDATDDEYWFHGYDAFQTRIKILESEIEKLFDKL